MLKSQLNELETKLLAKRQELTARKSDKAGSNADPDDGRDEGDRANASQTKEMNWLLSSQERGLLQLVDAALARIRDGSFGECEHCGQEVGIKRLTAIPWTRYCIACQELLEEYSK